MRSLGMKVPEGSATKGTTPVSHVAAEGYGLTIERMVFERLKFLAIDLSFEFCFFGSDERFFPSPTRKTFQGPCCPVSHFYQIINVSFFPSG